MQIYFINLASRPDRRAFMEGQFERLGLTAKRIEAIATASISEARHSEFGIRKDQAACSLSHESAWQQMLSDGHSAALILEDDALLSQSLPPFLAALRPDDGEIIRIETTFLPSRLLPASREVLPGIALHASRSTELGTAGYVISAKAAKAMLASGAARKSPLDIALFCPFLAPGRDLGHMATDPALCVQLGASDQKTTPLARSDIGGIDWQIAEVSGPPILGRIRRFTRRMSVDIPKTIDHFLNLARGLTKKRIAFLAT